MLKRTLFFAVFPVAATGCQGDHVPSMVTDTVPTVQREATLRPFSSCDALETYIEDTAVQEMEVQLDLLTQESGGSVDAGSDGPTGVPTMAGGGSPGGERTPSMPSDFTQTNTQVQGVDEADFVKTDGTRTFVLSGRKIYVARSWPPGDLAIEHKLELEGWPLEMFLDESGRVVVFSSWWPEFGGYDQVYCGAWGCAGSQGMTRVTVLDTTDDRLSIRNELFFPGQYVSSRRVGTSTRLVLREWLSGPHELRYWPVDFDGNPREDQSAFEAALEQLRADNERLIRGRTLQDWIPQAYTMTRNRRSDIALDCTRFHQPNTPVHLGLTTVITLDLASDAPAVDRTSVLGEVGEIYASRESLYLASPHWWWWPTPGQTSHTYIHKFDISEPSSARYVSSGGVEGWLLDQFSMDEHEGHLRVATTVQEMSSSDDDPWRFEVSNRVGVLASRGGRLIEVGQVSGLAPNEQIHSARFVGDKGFVVTFEQVDPLFTLDLSDPTAPLVVGELKVPGFSTYIHPLDEDHLLTIGVDLPEPDAQGRVDLSQRAMKLSLFDVSDFARPVEKFSHRVGTAHGWSEAGWDHKAFNWFPARKMLAIPFSDFHPASRNYWDEFVSDLRLFQVDVNSGIRAHGNITMDDMFIEHQHPDWSWRYTPWVRRSLMADDYAYAISDAGIRVVDMRNPSESLATASFDRVR